MAETMSSETLPVLRAVARPERGVVQLGVLQIVDQAVCGAPRQVVVEGAVANP